MKKTVRYCAAFAAAISIGLASSGCKSHERSPEELDLARAQENRAAGIEMARQAQANMQAGHPAEALKQYHRALELNPEQPAAWNNLGILLMEQKDNLGAATAFRRAAEQLPTDPRPYENLGLCFRNAGHGREALECYGKSLERDRYWLPSLRGAILGALELQQVDEVLLQRIDDALMVEKDAAWHTEFERYRTRVQGEIKLRN